MFMVTGDHHVTATAIAKQIGLIGEERHDVDSADDDDCESSTDPVEALKFFSGVVRTLWGIIFLNFKYNFLSGFSLSIFFKIKQFTRSGNFFKRL